MIGMERPDESEGSNDAFRKIRASVSRCVRTRRTYDTLRFVALQNIHPAAYSSGVATKHYVQSPRKPQGFCNRCNPALLRRRRSNGQKC
jgi:hypothetical protein